MRRLMAAVAWPIILVLYTLLVLSASAVVVLAKKNSHNDNDVRLKVDIRKETLVGAPSCQHTFTQIELLNLHPTEPIMIHSIQATPEETVLLKSESGASDGRKWEDHSVPQQIHISKLPSGSVSLGPGQVAIVPVTFLPRFPNLDESEEEERKRKLRNNHDDDNEDHSCDNAAKMSGGDNNTLQDYDSDASRQDGQSPPPISITALYDLVDMVGDERILHTIDNKRLLTHTLDPSYRRRNNLDSSSLPEIAEFRVTTTVVVDTSRGVVKLPVTASSERDNMYQIPDSIQFHHPSFKRERNACGAANGAKGESNGDISSNIKSGISSASVFAMDKVIILDAIQANEQPVSQDGSSSTPSRPRVERECFDLYLSNPMQDQELKIMEALISKPDYISIKFDPGRVTGVPDLNQLVGSDPSQVIRQWSQEGPLYLPPDSDDNYVLTLCTAFAGEIPRDQGSETYLNEMTKWIDTGNQDRNLGFLQIRIDGETLFLSLEHSDDIPFLSLKNTSQSLDLKRNTGDGIMLATQNADLGPQPHVGSSSSSLLKSTPDHVDFGMISPSSHPHPIEIGVQNKSPVPIRIMRVSTSLRSDDDLMPATELQKLGVQVNVTVTANGTQNEKRRSIDSVVLGPVTALNGVFTLFCFVDPDRFSLSARQDVYHLNGTVVIRGTMDTALSYDEWLEATIQNPYRDEHLTIEIPFSVSILNGRIEAVIEGSSHLQPELYGFKTWDLPGQSVSHLLFPMNQHVALGDLVNRSQKQVFFGSNVIRHDIRILSNDAIPIVLDHATIEDAAEQSSEARTFCQRFNVSTLTSFEKTGLYPGFAELGVLQLTYKFGKNRKSSMLLEGDSFGTIECMLKVSTSPSEAGSLNVPLWIFPGHLRVTSSRSIEQETSSSPSESSTVSSGFTSLLSWCKSSAVGIAFLELLRAKSEDRKGSKHDSTMLATYLKSTIQPSEIPVHSPKYLPILLQVGAVDHGEVATGSLYLSNRNPLPIAVSIKVGELDGSRIVLSREGSLAGGDGNSLWDYLPKQGSAKVIKEGLFEGHPVDGILEYFLADRKAQDFLSGFNFRDSISPHHSSLNGSDSFRKLYNFHSRATFHRTQFDETSGIDDSEDAPDRHPNEYTFHRDLNTEDYTRSLRGPFIVSSDKKLVRRLDQVRNSLSTEILIPPGAEARFLVQIRAPQKEYLDSDISQLVTTGLVLSSNFGEIMPIFASFEALQGQLQATGDTKNPYSRWAFEFGPAMMRYSNISIINVPTHLSWEEDGIFNEISWEDSEPIVIPPSDYQPQYSECSAALVAKMSKFDRSRIPLFLKSSFTRNMKLVKLESCNPWFRVTPVTPQSEESYCQMDGNSGVLVGYLSTRVECSDIGSSNSSVPSYYKCLHNWLMNRLSIQPESCGLGLLSDAGIDLRRIENIKFALEHQIRTWSNVFQVDDTWKGLTVNFQHNGTISNPAHAKTGRSRGEEIVIERESFATMLKASEVSTKYGYNWLSTSLTATVEYDSDPEFAEGGGRIEPKANLTLSVRDLALKSIISPPRLFRRGKRGETSHQFPSTLVGDVSESYIPLQNPTNVPVTVRMRVPPAAIWNSKPTEDERILFGNKANYFFPAPYVQDGDQRNFTSTSHHLWWEGEGGFFILDPEGDLIKSRHNITIKAGAGATVSLVNPSLHAQVALVAGCGRRCGLRDEKQQVLDYNVAYSPIGASAAAGITLTGTHHNASPQADIIFDPEPKLLAGGISVPGTGGPAAFALSYSSLDSIVIPPFGRGRIGPIYFRPPGSFKSIGCSVEKRSGTKLSGIEKDLCNRNFESLIYLENSMTGLEHVVLQGSSLSEKVIFVDPPASGDTHTFATIENHNGESTVLFVGSSDILATTRNRISIVKEVFIYNDGDTVAEVAAAGIVGRNSVGAYPLSCTYGNYELRDCVTSWLSQEKSEAQPKFLLKPGQGQSMLVEYQQDCSKRVDNANLVVDLLFHRSNSAPMNKESFQSRFSKEKSAFSAKTISLHLSYEVDVTLFAACVKDGVGVTGRKASWLLLCHVFLLMSSVTLLCFALRARFYAMWGLLRKVPTHLAYDQSRNISSKRSRSHWNAAFRCLARADPSSTELQGLGREQMRQVVTGLYKSRGIAPPPSLHSSTSTARERRNLTSSSATRRTGKDAVGGNARIRTLSDVIFQETANSDASSICLYLPVGIGWRTAFSRGILKEASTNSISVELSARVLQKDRDSSDLTVSGSSTEEDSFFIATKSNESISNNGSIQNDHPHTDSSTNNSTSVEQASKAPSLKVDTRESTSESKISVPLQSVQKASTKAAFEGGKQTEDRPASELDQEVASLPVIANENARSLGDNPIITENERASRPAAKEEKEHKEKTETPKRQKWKEKQRKGQTTTVVNERGDPSRLSVIKGTAPKVDTTKKAEVGNGIATLKSGKNKAQVELLGEAVKEGQSNEKDSGITSASSNSIRPPPGLAPPPGFGSFSSKKSLPEESERFIEMDASINNPASLESMLDVALTKEAEAELQADLACSPVRPPFSTTSSNGENSEMFLSRDFDAGMSPQPRLAESKNRFDFAPTAQRSLVSLESGTLLPIENCIGPLRTENSQTPALLNEDSQNGFDVMDFLDSILSEGGPLQDPGESEVANSLLGSSENSTPLLANPWASENRSRASAYGISFDEEDDSVSNGSTGSQIKGAKGEGQDPVSEPARNFPLLTPAAILNGTGHVTEEENGATDVPLSFLSDLVDD